MGALVLTGDTSGSVTVNVPTVAGTNTATFPAATGTVMVSGNMPAFSAYQSSAQTLSNGTFTKITLDTELFDTNNNFTSSRFTPTVAGYYQINGGFNYISSTANNETIVAIYKNGSVYSYLQDIVQGSVSRAVYGSNLVYLNGTTDYVELYGFLGTGGALSANSYSTYFSGVLVRGA